MARLTRNNATKANEGGAPSQPADRPLKPALAPLPPIQKFNKRKRLDLPSTDDGLDEPLLDGEAEGELKRGRMDSEGAEQAGEDGSQDAADLELNKGKGKEEVEVEEDVLDEESRDKILLILNAMDQKLFLLHFPFPITSSNPSSQPPPTTTLHSILTSSPNPSLKAIADLLETISPSTLSTRTTLTAPNHSTLEARSKWTQSVRYLLNAFGKGQRGKGLQPQPKKQVALYQKLPSYGQPPQWGGTFFTDPVWVDAPREDSDEEDDGVGLTGLGYANQIEIHPTPLLPVDQEPKLGPTSVPRIRRVVAKPSTGVPSHPVAILNPTPFSSFAPSYDSSLATISLTETVQRAKRDLQGSIERESQVMDSLDVVGRLKEESVREDEGEDAGMDVDGLLKRNWKRVDMLRQLQVGRVMRGEDKAGEAEENLAQQLSKSLIQLISVLSDPASNQPPHKLTTPSQLHSLQSLISLLNPRPSYRGTLDPNKPYTLKDNTTVRIHSLHPPQLASANRQNVQMAGRVGTPGNGQRPVGGQPGRPGPGQPFRPPLQLGPSSSAPASSPYLNQQRQPQPQQQPAYQPQRPPYQPSPRTFQPQHLTNGSQLNQAPVHLAKSAGPTPGVGSTPGTPVGVMGWRLNSGA